MTNAPKILMISTSADRLEPSGEETGLWLEELTTPYYAFLDAGAEITLASIKGGALPIDKRSLSDDEMKHASVQRYQSDETLKGLVRASEPLDEIDARGFDAVFLPGGHGTMTDFPDNATLARIVSDFAAEGRVVAAVCHGPAGLLGATNRDGSPLVKGKRVAAFLDDEEKAVQLLDVVPFSLQDELRDLGAKHEAGGVFEPFALRDGTLITGQNPQSAAKVAELTLEALKDTARAAA